MTRLRQINLARLCAGLAVMLALCVAPFIDAVKHGPAAAVAEADHAAFHHAQTQLAPADAPDTSPHSETGAAPADVGNAHHHHSIADHDHTPAVTLLAAAGLITAAPRPAWALVHLRADGRAEGGLPRPPRAVA